MSNATTTADRAVGWAIAGFNVTWTNHQPASDLVQWSRRGASANLAGAVPVFGSMLKMVCYELPIWAAYHAGVLTAQQLWTLTNGFDQVTHGSAAGIMAAITSSWSSRKTLGHIGTAAFSKGDIVFFNGVGHVALATGNSNVPNEVISVWGMNPIGTQANTPVEKTTITNLLVQIALGAPGLAQTVTYSRPTW